MYILEDFIRKSLIYHMNNANTEYVIYPFGYVGRLVKNIINNEYGINERFIANKRCLRNTDLDIKDLDYLKNDYSENKNYKLIIAKDYTVKPADNILIHRQIADFTTVDRIIDVCSPSFYFNPWNYMGEFFEFDNKKHTVIEILMREIYANNVQGAVAEAGVYRGKTAAIINYLFPDRKLYLFDTFSGFDIDQQNYDDANNLFNTKVDYSKTSEETVLNKMLFPQNCIIKKGLFHQNIADINDKFAFVRLDMDLYEPTYQGLEFFYPLLNPGGYISIHDCRSEEYYGAKEALLNFCRKYHLNYVNMHDELGTAVIPKGL